ncbi:MAG: entericidin A/B family lipoprotein [Gammaproteobacteria bacterium]|nr:entericidin A/B family lipoprotein [Gammaproteobacteria bacterium]
MKKQVLAVIMTWTCFMLSACEHTMEGFGQDMEQTGKAIQKSVKNG